MPRSSGRKTWWSAPIPEESREEEEFEFKPAAPKSGVNLQPIKPPTAIPKAPEIEPAALDAADEPIPLCDRCDSPLDSRGRCPKCDGVETLVVPRRQAGKPRPGGSPTASPKPKVRVIPSPSSGGPKPGIGSKPGKLPVPPLPEDDEILDLDQSGPVAPKKVRQPAPLPAQPKVKAPPLPAVVKPPPGKKPPGRTKENSGEDDFWKMLE